MQKLTAEDKQIKIINDKLSELLNEVNLNLTYIREINSFFFGTDIPDDRKEAHPASAGWFEYVIHMLSMIEDDNKEMKEELVKLKEEL